MHRRRYSNRAAARRCRKERHSAAFLSPRALYFLRTVCYGITVHGLPTIFKAIPHNSKCRYGERGATAAKPKAQIILDAAKVSAASGGNSEPKQGQRSQSARGFCPRSTMRVPQPDIIEHFGNADGAPQPLERCLSRQAEIVRCCLGCFAYQALARAVPRALQASVASPSGAPLAITGSATSRAPAA